MGDVLSMAKYRREREALALRQSGCPDEQVAQYRAVDEFVERWGSAPKVDHRDWARSCALSDLPLGEAATLAAILDLATQSVAEIRDAGLVFWSPRKGATCFAAVSIPPEGIAPWRHQAVDKMRLILRLPAGHAWHDALVVVRVESPDSWLPDPEVA